MTRYAQRTLIQQPSLADWGKAAGGASYGVATGGIGAPTSITVSGVNYNLLTFTATGTLTVTKSGLFDVLVFGGGAGGGSNGALLYYGGGGGAGGGFQTTIYSNANQTITIGAGGAVNAVGNNSQIGVTTQTILSVRGGNGGGDQIAKETGGCGGGGFGFNNANRFGATGQQGFAGGDGVAAGGSAGGGGGGVGAIGSNGSGTVGGAGGAGFDASTFRGEVATTTFYGGGGGGGGASGGAGGSGGGGARSVAGSVNTGGGGGSNNATGSNNPAAGGSGIVLIRFKV